MTHRGFAFIMPAVALVAMISNSAPHADSLDAAFARPAGSSPASVAALALDHDIAPDRSLADMLDNTVSAAIVTSDPRRRFGDLLTLPNIGLALLAASWLMLVRRQRS